MKVVKILGIAVIAALIAAPALFSQNFLKENQYYERAQELQQQAQEALDAGNYDKAVELSNQAETQIQKAREYADTQVLMYRANGWKKRAKKRIDYVKTLDAQEHFPEKFNTAQQAYEEAVSLFEEEEYQDSIHASQEAINALVEIRPQEDAKPKYYTVREIPERRDCFWRIAGYDFIYDNPWQWRKIYEANKEKLPEPGNPDWIEPGIVLEIPSISGEERAGMYDPNKQ